MVEGIGKRLEEARLAKGLSVQDAAFATKIHVTRIADLERDDYSNFPSIVYARSFLALYAKFLKVDISDLVERLSPGDRAVSLAGYEYLKGPDPTQDYQSHRTERKSTRSALPFVLGLLFLAGVIGTGFWYVNVNMERLGLQAPKPTPAPAAMPTPVATPEPTPVATPEPTPEPVVMEDFSNVPRAVPVNVEVPAVPQYEVELRPLKRTSVKIVVDDGTIAYDGAFKLGDKPIKAKGRKLTVEIRDKNAVEVFKNGQKIPKPETTFTIE